MFIDNVQRWYLSCYLFYCFVVLFYFTWRISDNNSYDSIMTLLSDLLLVSYYVSSINHLYLSSLLIFFTFNYLHVQLKRRTVMQLQILNRQVGQQVRIKVQGPATSSQITTHSKVHSMRKHQKASENSFLNLKNCWFLFLIPMLHFSITSLGVLHFSYFQRIEEI